MANILDRPKADAIRKVLADAQAPGVEKTFIDRITGLEKALDLLLQALEQQK